MAFTNEILFLVLKFVLNKINLTWHSTKLNIVLFFVRFWINWVWFLFHYHTDTLLGSVTPSTWRFFVGTYGKSLSSAQRKKHPRSSSSGFPFIVYLLNSTMKSRQNAILLSHETNFFPSCENIDNSVRHSDVKRI